MLTIGIKNGTDKGFTKEELEVTNGFHFGIICMHAGVGRIGDKAYRTVISAEEACDRFKIVMDEMPLWEDQENTFPYKWLTDVDNIKRLEENSWYCNAGNKKPEHFLHHMKNIIMNKIVKRTQLEGHYKATTYEDTQRQKEAVRTVLGLLLTGEAEDYYDDNQWIVDTITDAFEPYDHWNLSKPFYNGQYLVYDLDTYEYKLADKPQEE